MNRLTPAAVVLSAMLASPLVALACNACLEDKIAATYDAEVVSRARQQGHMVVFTAIGGRIAPGDSAVARAIRHRLSAVHGVDPGTVRVSLAPPAASFACDVAHHPPVELVAAANRSLKAEGLSLQLVRLGAPGGAIVARTP